MSDALFFDSARLCQRREKQPLSDPPFMSTRCVCLRIHEAFVSCLAGSISPQKNEIYDLIEELFDKKIIHKVNLVIKFSAEMPRRHVLTFVWPLDRNDRMNDDMIRLSRAHSPNSTGSLAARPE